MKATRRDILKTAFAGCCAAASPIVTPVTFAATPGENRLVVIILRGGMDGLGVFAPYGDRAFADLRPSLGGKPEKGLLDLDGRFGMDKRLEQLHPLWDRGELAVAHAVSTPYRDKRSHFDGQDILEAGTMGIADVRDGWINRALGHLTGASADTAYSVGRENMLITSGPNRARSWAPGERLPLENDERALLSLIYANDPLFANAAEDAMELTRTTGDRKAEGARAVEVLADYAAGRLNEDARIAAFSIGGWDSHVNQRVTLRGPLAGLETAIVRLKKGLGRNWRNTMVIAMTEFGRTARENGGRGTDHGTGGAALLAGGALKGGRVYGDWPGVGEGALYQDRDLTPTRDVRHYPAYALINLFGMDRAAVTRDVFPGLDLGADDGFIA